MVYGVLLVLSLLMPVRSTLSMPNYSVTEKYVGMKRYILKDAKSIYGIYF